MFFLLPSQDSSDSTDHVKTRHHKTTKSRATRSGGDSTVNEERAANRLSTRALYDTEEEDEVGPLLNGWLSDNIDYFAER